MRRPIVVAHSFGELGSGGPIAALGRVLESELARKYEFIRMHQPANSREVDLGLLARWVSLLRRTQPDLVHVRGLGNEGFRAALAARMAGCPRILVSIHGTARDLKHGRHSIRRDVLVRALEPATLRMATHLATVCHSAVRREFLQPYRSKLIGVVPNGVALPAGLGENRSRIRRQLDVADGTVVCVVVGRLSFEKGHAVLAEALRRLPSFWASAVLVLVGDGPDRESIEECYASVPQLRVQTLGRRLDVSAILEAADVFLFPTLHENLSNALLEGMAAGLPVIASAVGGNVEILEFGGGVLVPPSDPDALADAITKILGSPDLRADLGRRAREVIRERYTVDAMIVELERVYESIISGGC